MGANTPGARLYAVRLACGDGVRSAESLADFSVRVKKRTGRHYDPATISLLERMKQGWKLEDVEVFAAVDPLKRGREWLAFGPHEEAAAPRHNIEEGQGMTVAEALDQHAEDLEKEKAERKPGRRKTG